MGRRAFVVRLRHDKGLVTTTVVVADARAAVESVLALERTPARTVQWVKVHPTCDYCDQPASRFERGGQETPLCGGCARDHYGSAQGVRDATGRLGVTRLVEVPSEQWR